MNHMQDDRPTMKPKTRDLMFGFAILVSHMSTAKRLKVGAVIVKDDNVLGYGYNGTPVGDDNCCEDENDVTKPTVIHAELNAIYKVAKSNNSCNGSTLIMTHSPCMHCATAILHSGITEVRFIEPYRDLTAVNWLRDKGINVLQQGFGELA